MDPITITASLFAALAAAVKEKAVGAAAKYLQEAVEDRARRLWGVIGESNEEKFARLMVTQVMSEADQFPPQKALRVELLATVGVVGIWGPRGTLKLNVLWINRADFRTHVREVRITGKVGGRQCEWDSVLGEEFTLNARSDAPRIVELEPKLELPSFERGGATCDVSLSALVCGPWEEGRAQRTQDLLPVAGIWLPVVGIEPSGLMTEDADIDLMLEDHLRELVDKGEHNVRIHYAEIDRTLRLQPGATKQRLAAVAGRRSHVVNAGPSVALVKLHHATQYVDGGYGSSGSSRNPFDY